MLLVDNLPNKASELLALALKDIKKVSKDKRYYIDMGTYHRPSSYRYACNVCLAGSVLAKSCNIDPNTDIAIEHIKPVKFRNKILALNDLRRGLIGSALQYLGNNKFLGLQIRVSSSDYSECFIKEMQQIIRILKAMGQ